MSSSFPQHPRIFLSPPHLGEEEARLVAEAFASNYIAPVGPMVDAFEREMAEYLGIEHCVAVASGTAAMHLALRCLGVGPGDEVIASTLTFIGSVSPIVFLGGVPVFVDSERESWNMDPALLEEELERCRRRGKLPKAIVPTDLYGQCCNMPKILEIAARYGVPVVVDAAEAMGARYRTTTGSGEWLHAGKGAAAAVFSFNGNKILTTSGGGLLASDDPRLIEEARFLSQQARDPAPHYEHSVIGYNYRLSNILAAIGRGQLKVLEERVRRKREVFQLYQEMLGDVEGIEFMPEAPWSKSNRWLTVILVDARVCGTDRERLRVALEAENIESRPVWKPMHLQRAFRQSTPTGGQGFGACAGPGVGGEAVEAEWSTVRRWEGGRGHSMTCGCRTVGGAVAEDLFARGLCLPSGTAMTDGDVARISALIRETVQVSSA